MQIAELIVENPYDAALLNENMVQRMLLHAKDELERSYRTDDLPNFFMNNKVFASSIRDNSLQTSDHTNPVNTNDNVLEVITPNMRFLKNRYSNFEHHKTFQDVLLQPNHTLLLTALFDLYNKLIIYLHKKFVYEFLYKNYKHALCFRSVFLELNEIFDEEGNTTEQILEVIRESFKF
ncbi:hypothetical protein BDAP_001389 [Binucleata daphniae]